MTKYYNWIKPNSLRLPYQDKHGLCNKIVHIQYESCTSYSTFGLGVFSFVLSTLLDSMYRTRRMQQVVNIVVLSVGELYAAVGAAVEQSPFVISLVVSRYSSHIGEEAGVRLLPLRSKLCEKLLEKHSLNLPTW